MRRICDVLKVVALFALSALGAVFGLPMSFAAALTTEAPVTMWQKVENYFTTNLGASISPKPGSAAVFRAIKSWMMQHLAGINLQLVQFSDLTVDINPLDGVIVVYAIFVKKQNTATDAYFKVFDDVADDATSTDAKISIALLGAQDEAIVFYPNGLPLATGLVIGSYTTVDGANNTTPTTTGDGPQGFLLVG